MHTKMSLNNHKNIFFRVWNYLLTNEKHNIWWFSWTIYSNIMGVSQGKYDTLLWYCGPILHRQTFSKGIYCMVLMKSHYMSQIHNTSLAINRLCFSKNRKWRWKAWWKAYKTKVIDTFSSSNIFIHHVWIWLLGTPMITSCTGNTYVECTGSLTYTHNADTPSLLTFFLHIVENNNKTGVLLLSHSKENYKIKPNWLWLCPVGILIDS